MIGLSPEGETNSSPLGCSNPLGQGIGPFKGEIDRMCLLSNKSCRQIIRSQTFWHKTV